MTKSDYYEITATVIIKHKVCFNEPVTFAEAERLFIEDEYADVIDEEPISIVKVNKVVAIGGE